MHRIQLKGARALCASRPRSKPVDSNLPICRASSLIVSSLIASGLTPPGFSLPFSRLFCSPTRSFGTSRRSAQVTAWRGTLVRWAGCVNIDPRAALLFGFILIHIAAIERNFGRCSRVAVCGSFDSTTIGLTDCGAVADLEPPARQRDEREGRPHLTRVHLIARLFCRPVLMANSPASSLQPTTTDRFGPAIFRPALFWGWCARQFRCPAGLPLHSRPSAAPRPLLPNRGPPAIVEPMRHKTFDTRGQRAASA